MTKEESESANIGALLVSVHSAKDPLWNEKYPGMHVSI